jgi:hypothetical protein
MTYELGYLTRHGEFIVISCGKDARSLQVSFMSQFTSYQIRRDSTPLVQFAGYDANYVRNWLVRTNYDGSRGLLAWHG